MGKTRVIAETGAGQHGVATATAAALMGLDCTVYMGKVDTERQALNVARMKILGAEVVPVEHGSATLKDAINEALRDWVTNVSTTHYLIGTVTGPHPFPEMVRDFHKIIGEEAREQVLELTGRLPGRRHRLRRRRFQRDGHLPPLRAGCRGAPDRHRGRRRGRRVRPARGAVRLDRDPGRAARRDELPHAGRRRPDRRVALDLRGPGLPERRARARLAARQRPRRVPLRHRRPRRWRRSACSAAPRASSRPSSRPTRWSAPWRSGRSSAPTPCCSSTCPAAATRTWRPPRSTSGCWRGRGMTTTRARRRGGAAPLPRGGPRRARRLPAGRLPDRRGLDRGDAGARRGRLRHHRGRGALQRPADGRPGHPARRRHGAGRWQPRRRRLPRDGRRARRRRHPARHDLLEPRDAPRGRAVRRRPRRRTAAPG